MNAPGITLGTQSAQVDPASMWATVGTYAPTAIEVVIVIGAVAGGFAIWMLLSKKFLPSYEPAAEA